MSKLTAYKLELPNSKKIAAYTVRDEAGQWRLGPIISDEPTLRRMIENDGDSVAICPVKVVDKEAGIVAVEVEIPSTESMVDCPFCTHSLELVWNHWPGDTGNPPSEHVDVINNLEACEHFDCINDEPIAVFVGPVAKLTEVE